MMRYGVLNNRLIKKDVLQYDDCPVLLHADYGAGCFCGRCRNRWMPAMAFYGFALPVATVFSGIVIVGRYGSILKLYCFCQHMLVYYC